MVCVSPPDACAVSISIAGEVLIVRLVAYGQTKGGEADGHEFAG
jgi:hypothetical protein